jgi:hypothetical protein
MGGGGFSTFNTASAAAPQIPEFSNQKFRTQTLKKILSKIKGRLCIALVSISHNQS